MYMIYSCPLYLNPYKFEFNWLVWVGPNSFLFVIPMRVAFYLLRMLYFLTDISPKRSDKQRQPEKDVSINTWEDVKQEQRFIFSYPWLETWVKFIQLLISKLNTRWTILMQYFAFCSMELPAKKKLFYPSKIFPWDVWERGSRNSVRNNIKHSKYYHNLYVIILMRLFSN